MYQELVHYEPFWSKLLVIGLGDLLGVRQAGWVRAWGLGVGCRQQAAGSYAAGKEERETRFQALNQSYFIFLVLFRLRWAGLENSD
jgi:hypothetical protein